MIFEIQADGRIYLPDWLDRTLRVWFVISFALLPVGLVIFSIGVVDYKWVMLLGLLLIFPVVLFTLIAEFVVVAALLVTLALKLTSPRRGSWKKPARMPSKPLWDPELDG
jgi:hypothetical protein